MTRKARRKKLHQRALVGAFVASAALSPRPAHGRELIDLLRHSDALQTAGREAAARRFDIPPGQLSVVVAALQRQTGETITLSDPAAGVVYSPGVSGFYTLERALEQALAGTSLSFRRSGPRALVVELRVNTESVNVTGRAPVTIASPKFTEPLRDTPQSIDVVPSEVIADQGATTLRDAVRNVAGISLAAGEGGAQGDNLTIRGFTARNDIFIDGMRDFGSYYRDPFNQEQVQVLKGPSSVAFGRGTTGGVLNQATKTPERQSFVNGTANFGTDDTKRVTLDVNEPVTALGDGAAFRLNLMATDAGVAGRDVANNRRYGVAPSLVVGLGSPTRATFSLFHQAENDVPDYGIPWRFNQPAPVARNVYYGFADTNFLKTRADIAGAKVEHQFGANVNATNQLRYANYGRHAQITEARIPAGVTPSTPLDTIMVDRNQITVDSTETFLQNQFDVTSRFATGPVRHTLVTGLELSRETSDPTRRTFAGVPNTSLLSPNPAQAFAGTPTISSRVAASAASIGAYALDTVSLGDRVDLMAGARWDRFDADVRQSIGAATAFTRVDSQPSWRGALVYKPASSGSVYVDYGTSFNPSAESLSLTAATVSLPPESNRTVEVGSKWDLSSERLSLRAALFQTQKLNAREPDPNNSLLNVLSGTQRVNGFEAETSGRVTDRWRLMASYALLDSELVKSTAFPASVGSRLANVPKNSLSVWSSVALGWRLEIGGGGQYIGRRTASSTAPLDATTGLLKALPGYWVANAMAKRTIGSRVDVQLNVLNVTNEYYFDQLHPGHIVPGPGRAALIGLNFRY
ncbi:MAG: TonB-dependent siderophore receptor [Vicinamibacterales bacterium]